MGLPDLAVSTLSDVVEDARRITRVRRASQCMDSYSVHRCPISLCRSIATQVLPGTVAPLLVDIDTSFGGALCIERTIKDMEAAGVAAVHLEDQVRSYHTAEENASGFEYFFWQFSKVLRLFCMIKSHLHVVHDLKH